MASITKLEYRVRKVERYIITRYEEREEDPRCAQAGSSSVRGEFSDANTAYEVAYALCKVEHDVHLGWPPDDERVQYPRHPNADEAGVRVVRGPKADAQIKHMVDRFLQWRLPEHFNPDGGISFDKSYRSPHGPVGTNLLDATQAEVMVRHMLEGLPSA